MNKIRASKFGELSSITLAILTIVLVVAVSGASAKEHGPKGPGAGSQVGRSHLICRTNRLLTWQCRKR
jgi:hypothetical protein